MGEVRYFNNGDDLLNERGVNDECVKTIEDILAKARAGEIIGVVVENQFADGSTGSARGGFLYNSRIVGGLMGSVMALVSGR